MHYYYDRNGHYLGGNNTRQRPSEAAGATAVAPEHAGQVWDVRRSKWEEPVPADTADSMLAGYRRKVAGYDRRKVKAALRFARSAKKVEILNARLAALGA